jgi:hypothetical protein
MGPVTVSTVFFVYAINGKTVLITQHSALSTQHSALSTQHSALSPSLGALISATRTARHAGRANTAAICRR